MKKMKNLLMVNLPIVGFMMFAIGGAYFVIGSDRSIAHFSVIGGVVSLLGLFIFVYGNMLNNESGQNKQH